MRACELMLGNWIHNSEIGKPIQIGHMSFQAIHADITLFNSAFKPIPLTPEILKKCGFVKDGEGDYCLGDIVIKKQFGKLTLLLDIGHIAPPMEYLHQLQNLYFALTGEQLAVEL